jgi:hypothetical protein
MPSVFIPLPVPFVPAVPGVPPLPVSLPGVPPVVAIAASAVSLVLSDVAGAVSFVNTAQWGIFDPSGNPVLVADATASIEYARDYRISDYPQEQGAFASYNKVQLPFEAKVGFFINKTRVPFLNTIEAELASLDLVSVVTPEITYPSANLTHYGYRRVQRDGVSLMLVEVWAEEVRVTASASLSNAQSTNAQPTQQNGATQAQQAPLPTTPAISTTQQFNNAVTTQAQANTMLAPSPGYFSPSTLPVAPQPFNVLPNAQQQAITVFGQQKGSTTAYVSAPDASGNSTVNYLP